jgi:hypothetical protein
MTQVTLFILEKMASFSLEKVLYTFEGLDYR